MLPAPRSRLPALSIRPAPFSRGPRSSPTRRDRVPAPSWVILPPRLSRAPGCRRRSWPWLSIRPFWVFLSWPVTVTVMGSAPRCSSLPPVLVRSVAVTVRASASTSPWLLSRWPAFRARLGAVIWPRLVRVSASASSRSPPVRVPLLLMVVAFRLRFGPARTIPALSSRPAWSRALPSALMMPPVPATRAFFSWSSAVSARLAFSDLIQPASLKMLRPCSFRKPLAWIRPSRLLMSWVVTMPRVPLESMLPASLSTRPALMARRPGPSCWITPPWPLATVKARIVSSLPWLEILPWLLSRSPFTLRLVVPGPVWTRLPSWLERRVA